jgi:hypothetical protein
MSRDRTPRDSAAVLVGIVASALFAWAVWNGLFDFISHPLSLAVAGNQTVDGNVGSSPLADLVATAFEGLMWLIGQAILWLMMGGWRGILFFFKWLITCVATFVKNTTEDGREAIQHVRDDREAVAPAASQSQPLTQSQVIASLTEENAQLRADVDAINAWIAASKQTWVNNRAVRKLLVAAPSFKAFKTALDAEFQKPTDEQGAQDA